MIKHRISQDTQQLAALRNEIPHLESAIAKRIETRGGQFLTQIGNQLHNDSTRTRLGERLTSLELARRPKCPHGWCNVKERAFRLEGTWRVEARMAERDKAFVEFVEAASPSLRRTAYLIGGDWHKADDVVQETLYKLYLAWPKVQRAGNPFAYTRRMLVNVANDGSRRPWRREVTSAEVPEYAFQNGHAWLTPSARQLTACGTP